MAKSPKPRDPRDALRRAQRQQRAEAERAAAEAEAAKAAGADDADPGAGSSPGDAVRDELIRTGKVSLLTDAEEARARLTQEGIDPSALDDAAVLAADKAQEAARTKAAVDDLLRARTGKDPDTLNEAERTRALRNELLDQSGAGDKLREGRRIIGAEDPLDQDDEEIAEDLRDIGQREFVAGHLGKAAADLTPQDFAEFAALEDRVRVEGVTGRDFDDLSPLELAQARQTIRNTDFDARTGRLPGPVPGAGSTGTGTGGTGTGAGGPGSTGTGTGGTGTGAGGTGSGGTGTGGVGTGGTGTDGGDLGVDPGGFGTGAADEPPPTAPPTTPPATGGGAGGGGSEATTPPPPGTPAGRPAEILRTDGTVEQGFITPDGDVVDQDGNVIPADDIDEVSVTFTVDQDDSGSGSDGSGSGSDGSDGSDDDSGSDDDTDDGDSGSDDSGSDDGSDGGTTGSSGGDDTGSGAEGSVGTSVDPDADHTGPPPGLTREDLVGRLPTGPPPSETQPVDDGGVGFVRPAAGTPIPKGPGVDQPGSPDGFGSGARTGAVPTGAVPTPHGGAIDPSPQDDVGFSGPGREQDPFDDQPRTLGLGAAPTAGRGATGHDDTDDATDDDTDDDAAPAFGLGATGLRPVVSPATAAARAVPDLHLTPDVPDVPDEPDGPDPFDLPDEPLVPHLTGLARPSFRLPDLDDDDDEVDDLDD